jgi:hypothetical protein
VVRDLEHVDRRQAAGEQDRVHVVLGVAGQEEAPVPVLAQQHDRAVVGLAIVGCPGIELGRSKRAVVGPEDAQAAIVEAEEVAAAQPSGL